VSNSTVHPIQGGRRVNRPGRWRIGFGGLSAVAIAILVAVGGARFRHHGEGKRVRMVEPGRLIRAAWQDPADLRKVINRFGIKTIVTLTAINRDDPKYIKQAAVVVETGVNWIIVPMRGSQATLEQMAEAADLLADGNLQPLLFHCVAGHHRTSLAHAAYLIRHRQWDAQAAWTAVAALPWARPGSAADQNDRALIEAFASVQQQLSGSKGHTAREADDADETAIPPDRRLGPGRAGDDHTPRRVVSGLGPGHL
jgi:hypothetical protein